MTNESLNKLSKDNILLLYRYLFFYTKEYVSYYGGFDWNDATIANFCQKHNIIKKGRRNQVYKSCFFWFSTFTPKGEKVNDVAHHFLRHIRNAIAQPNFPVGAKSPDIRPPKAYPLQIKPKLLLAILKIAPVAIPLTAPPFIPP